MFNLHLAIAAVVAMAFSVPVQSAPSPRLIIAISVDQFSSNLFEQYRPYFTGGLKRVSKGTVYVNGYQAHGTTETCPGHATILTGSHPARSGIIANDWTDFAAPREDKIVYCAEDERVPGSSSNLYTVSPYHLKVPTLSDRMQQAGLPVRMVSVAGKDRSAMMMAGHNADQVWYWKKDKFLPVQAGNASPIAEQVNASVAHAIALVRQPLDIPAFCEAKNKPVSLDGERTVGTHRFQRAAGDADAFTRSPELDAATLAMAAALTQQMGLGRGEGTDILAIGLSATDLVGHLYGTGGVEMCLQLASLDADLADFFDVLDQAGIDYTVVLTADHGGLDLPERQHLQGVTDAARITPGATPEEIGAEVARRLGIAAPVFIDGWYLAPAVPQARRAEVIALAKQLLLAHPQIAYVYTGAEIIAHPAPTASPEKWSMLDRVKASFDPERSAALYPILKANITPIPAHEKNVATHGSPWDYDRRVPILFWRKGMQPVERTQSAMTVDIMPTLAAMIGFAIPANEIDGHCLTLPGLVCPAF